MSSAALATMTVEQSLALVLADVAAEQSKSSQHTYRWHARNAAATWGAETPLEQITKLDVQTWANARRKNVSAATLRHEVSFLSRMFKTARERGHRFEIPTEDLRLPKINNWRQRTLSEMEEMQLRQILTVGQWSPIEFALNTGFRRCEQWALKAEDVEIWPAGEHADPKTGISVPVALGVAHIRTSKTGKGRSVPLNHKAAAIVQLWCSRNKEYVFGPDRANRAGAADWYADNVWRPALEKLGFKDLHWHDLRHTFATRALKGGARPEQISKVLGHTSLAMTNRYMHFDQDLLWPAVMAAAGDIEGKRIQRPSVVSQFPPVAAPRKRVSR
ncbi:MAG: site-specific integrase [Candidatus Eremiobacteraeota bacterium]|nr:site-specific integrase [Candidatus Eremiobacteraeota bacterium]